MDSRRKFLKYSALGAGALLTGAACSNEPEAEAIEPAEDAAVVPVLKEADKPFVVSTWIHGMDANLAAWKVLVDGGYAFDAVEAGVRVSESDVTNQSVGIGGRPDREGLVTLDACIMNEASECGAVAFLQGFENPISVARKVMEETPHVMLVGAGAAQFALEQGFTKTDLLTPGSEKEYLEWLEASEYKPVINIENHDTIGMLALDAEGRLSGACTTSGAAYKLHGRVGDSPIIGAGLFVDGDVGAACATGLGEAVIRVAGSAMVVELMRNGESPADACRIVVERIIKKHKNLTNLQVGFLALNKFGEHGGHSVYAGFNYATTTTNFHELTDAPYKLEW